MTIIGTYCLFKKIFSRVLCFDIFKVCTLIIVLLINMVDMKLSRFLFGGVYLTIYNCFNLK